RSSLPQSPVAGQRSFPISSLCWRLVPLFCGTHIRPIERKRKMRIACVLRIALAVVVGAACAAAQTGPATIGTVKNVVLVHGAGTDGSGWRGVHDILIKDGYEVSVVQQPLTGLNDDVAATRRVLDRQDGPVIL